MAKLGEVEFMVISETPSFSNTVTEKPVEGGTITDNVKQNSTILDITGVVAEEGAFIKLQQLRRYSKSGELLLYTGRNIFANVVFERFDTTHTVKVRNGFEFSIKLKEVRIATAQTVEVAAKDPASSKKQTKTQTKPTTKQGKKVPTPKPTNVEVAAKVAGKYVGDRYISGTMGGASI